MQLLTNALIAGSLVALLAGGLALVYGVLGVFNLALGQLALVGGYSVWFLHREVGMPLMLSVPLGVGIGGLITWITFEIFIAPFYKRHRFLPLVTTIALSMMLDGLILLLFEERPHAIMRSAKHFLSFESVRVSVEQLLLICSTLVFLCVVAAILHATRIGRQVRASTQHSEAASSLGISAPFLHRLLFIASGVLAGLAGVYVGIDQTLVPTLGFTLTIKAYAALVAGGKDNIWGTILCAYLIALIEQLAVGIAWFGFFVPASYQNVVALMFIIVILLVKPSGLFSHRSRFA
jgi:branched-subunit amino acid ABC-type transport system permease component